MKSEVMFSSTKTCEIVGITYRQLDYWARKGLFRPTHEANGSGSRRQYSFRDLVNLRVIKNMLDNGMNLKDIQRATDYLAQHGEDIANADLIMNQNKVFLHDASQPQALFDLIQNGQGVFTIVALSQAEKHVEQEISNELEAKPNSAIGVA